jgi:hypothetical protein
MAEKEKTVKRVVKHPKYYMAVDGVPQHIEVGTILTLSESEAERKKGMLADPSEAKQLKDGELVKAGDSNNAKAMQQLAEQLAASQDEVKALKKAAK